MEAKTIKTKEGEETVILRKCFLDQTRDCMIDCQAYRLIPGRKVLDQDLDYYGISLPPCRILQALNALEVIVGGMD